MNEHRSCPQCGATLPDEGWQGLCPRCLVRVSVGAPPHGGKTETQNLESDLGRVRYFGDYELFEEIARGGMGVVYKARQVSLNRVVALKMILSGQFATAADVQRFRTEAEAAANLSHPNIVAIHEVGLHEGQHYFSMDFVDGKNLAELVREGPLSARQAAQYIQVIADAIHYAHEKGILHRDLKPSNVLIDPFDQPRVTDFGLAKKFGVSPSGGKDAQTAEVGTPNDLTQSGQLLGSPNFMPPEQAAARRGKIGPHSDVYSLGAMLYHLLTARPPFVAETVAETLQQLLDAEPVSPRLLNSSVPRDLETICLKCLEKEPGRRYESARELALDLRRFLNHEPVLARPPTALYRFQKLARRNKVAFTAVAVILLALVTGLGVATWGLMRERAARARAEAAEKAAKAQFVRSDRVADFLTNMLMGVRPSVALGRDTMLLRDILDRAAERLEKDLKDEPLIEAALREMIASAFIDLAEFPRAETMARQSLLLRQKVLPHDHGLVATALANVAVALDSQGKSNEAEALYREALAIWKKLSAKEDRNTILARNNLAGAFYHQGKFAAAEALFRENLETSRKRFGDADELVSESLNNLAKVLMDEGKYSEAERLYQQALDILKKLYPNGHPKIATILNSNASLLENQARYTEAEALYREAYAMQIQFLGNDHPDLAFSMSNIAGVLRAQGKYAEAAAQIRGALALREKKLGKEHPLTTRALGNLAVMLLDQHNYDEAEALQREVLANRKKLHGDEHPEIAICLNNLAGTLQQSGRYSDAEPIHRQAVAMAKKLLGPDHPTVAGILSAFIGTLSELGKYDEAEIVSMESLALYKKQFGEDHPYLANVLNDLAQNFMQTGKFPKAEELHRQALAIRRKHLGDEHPQVIVSINNFADSLMSQQKYAEAEPFYRESLSFARKFATNDPTRIEKRLYALADALYRQQKFPEAEPFYREILQSRRARLPADHEDVNQIHASLGRFLSEWAWTDLASKSSIRSPQSEIVARAREAEILLRESLAIRLRGTNASHWRTDDVKSRLGGVLLTVIVADPSLTTEARQSQLGEAEALLLESAGKLKQDKSSDRRLTRDAIDRLVRLYQSWDMIAPGSGKSAQAEAWKKKLDAFRAESEPLPNGRKAQ